MAVKKEKQVPDEKENKNAEQGEENPVKQPECETAKAEEGEKTAGTAAETVNAEEAVKITAELESIKERYLRLAAEYDNYRKRTAKEKDTIYADAMASTVAAFLPVADNLTRAADQCECGEEAYKSLKEGIVLTLRQLEEVLAKLNVKEITAQGEQFDPELHNAVMHIEDESIDDNTIVEVFQKGFKIGDRVIRHAVVKVAN